jgi:hypothetical protein
MDGISVEDFSSSVAYLEIFGLGRQEAGRRAIRKVARRAGRKAVRPKPPLSPCVCSNAAAARSTPAKKSAFRPCPSAPLKPWPMPCLIFRDLRISRPG